jgi:hypothetical protein
MNQRPMFTRAHYSSLFHSTCVLRFGIPVDPQARSGERTKILCEVRSSCIENSASAESDASGVDSVSPKIPLCRGTGHEMYLLPFEAFPFLSISS